MTAVMIFSETALGMRSCFIGDVSEINGTLGQLNETVEYWSVGGLECWSAGVLE
jgi:hypothetical protein